MQNNKQINTIISILAVVILIGGGVYLANKNKQAQVAPTTTVPTDSGTPATTTPVTNATAWDVFQEYLGFLKNHDIKSVNSVLSEHAVGFGLPCPIRSSSTETNCNNLMDLAYKSGSALTKASFKNNAEDSKQIVLSTDVLPAPQPTDKPNEISYQKGYLFFTKDSTGSTKFLASYHILSTISFKDISTVTATQKAQTVTNSFKDADADALLDKYESCTSANGKIPSLYNPTCTTTIATKKDSVGDGWWDGVRVFFAHK